MQIKLLFTRKVVHLASFWKWRFLELGSVVLRGDRITEVAVRRGSTVPSFLSNFKTLSIGLVLAIEPAISCSAVKRSADWAGYATVIRLIALHG